MNRQANRAADSLVYYFRLCVVNSGGNWDSDNESEIRQIIENIFEGVYDVVSDAINGHESSNYHAE